MYNGKITILVLQSPSYKVLLTKGHPSYQDIFQMCQDSNILVNCPPPLKRDHPSNKDTFSLLKGWPYKRGNTVPRNTCIYEKYCTNSVSGEEEHRGHGRMVVGFTTTCAISTYHH